MKAQKSKQFANQSSLVQLMLPVLFISIVFSGCKKPEPDNPVTDLSKGYYVLNEGSWQMNNTSLSFVNLNGNVLPDAFVSMNGRGLGDTGSDLQIYGGKMYGVVNISETLEIMNLEAKSLHQISLAGRSPRKIAFYQNHAYVSCYDGSVLKIDTATFEIVAVQQAGSNPDGICVANGKLYVANSGGLNYPNYGKSVSVFDLATFTLLKNITVSDNPTRIAADSHGDVYLVSNGNYGDVPAVFQRIDSQTDEVVQIFDFPVTNFAICGDLCYFYYYDYATNQAVVKVLDVSTETIVNENFIQDNISIQTPYGIAVSADGSEILLTDALQYTTNGDLLRFSSNGHLLGHYEVGMNPAIIVEKNR